MPPSKTATRFWIDPSMSDQQIYDLIMDLKLSAKVETGEVAFPEDEVVPAERNCPTQPPLQPER